MIIARFDNVQECLDRKLVGYNTVCQVPQAGETINLDGNPYLVKAVGWASETTKVPPNQWSEAFEGGLWAYVDVVPLWKV